MKLKLGETIRMLRGNMTQAELAQRAGIDKAIICKIESGKMAGTVACHKKLAETFGFKLFELYAFIEDGNHEAIELHPGDKETDTYQNYLEILTTRSMSKKMLPTYMTIRPKEEKSLELTEKKVERFIFLLKGDVEVEVDGKSYHLKKEITAKKGDSLYSVSPNLHKIRNVGHSVAQLLCVSAPPVL